MLFLSSNLCSAACNLLKAERLFNMASDGFHSVKRWIVGGKVFYPTSVAAKRLNLNTGTLLYWINNGKPGPDGKILCAFNELRGELCQSYIAEESIRALEKRYRAVPGGRAVRDVSIVQRGPISDPNVYYPMREVRRQTGHHKNTVDLYARNWNDRASKRPAVVRDVMSNHLFATTAFIEYLKANVGKKPRKRTH
jgi:hypothetical protein